jgi:Rieske Fe-S protein
MEEVHDSGFSPTHPLAPRRRALLTGAGVACAAMLAGCAARDSTNAALAPSRSAAPVDAPAAHALAATSQIPEGGGTVIDAERMVITQPSPETFRAFSAICTHAGCFVGSVSNGTINCPCHGSEFSIKDGSVVRGPATRPLPGMAIKVEGTSIFPG